MPTHKHTRPYFQGLRRSGAQNVGDTPLEDPVRMVAIADDHRQVLPPLTGPLVATSQFVTAAVGLTAGFECQVLSPGGTMWLGWFANEGSSHIIFTTAVTIGGLGATRIPFRATPGFGDFVAGIGAPQNRVAAGDSGFLPGNQPQVFLRENQNWFPGEGVYVEPGLFMVVMHAFTNSNTRIGLMYREIP